MTLASRIGVMDAGRIVQVGEPADIYEHPVSRQVADFVGSVNLFEGRVIEDEREHLRIRSDAAGGEIFVGHGASVTLDQKVWYALRPEKLRITRERPEGVVNVLAGTVDEVAYQGNLSVYRVRLKSGVTVRATRANVQRTDEARITWDETVFVHWDDDAGVVLTQ